MSDIFQYAAVAIVLLVLGASVIISLYILAKDFFSLIAITGHSLTPLPKVDKIELERISPFYAALPPYRKKAFSKQVKEFIFDKDWEGRGIELTREMKLHIASVAVQIGFGLGRLLFIHFERVVVYSDEYRNRITGKNHLGEVAPGARQIVLSWKHFIQGEADAFDGSNLGLHEMAHALWLENKIDNAESDFLEPTKLARWKELALIEADLINKGSSSLFRKYAASNQAEFFAVAVENFFERPKAFKQELPEIYITLASLLKQDPANA
ncbi:MAG: zinc-dependent peptidase [Flavobacteriales bacterium]|nr:zinc-dependent peptidase [Flavobacteriales bacterium]